jgi:hypothetical protein
VRAHGTATDWRTLTHQVQEALAAEIAHLQSTAPIELREAVLAYLLRAAVIDTLQSLLDQTYPDWRVELESGELRSAPVGANAMQRWHIGFPTWVVPDGTYSDVERGQRMEFAVEFYPSEILLSNDATKRVTHAQDTTYVANAEVVYLTDDAWVLDFGLLAYESPTGTATSGVPSTVSQGSFVTVTMSLGIDTYPYFEFLHSRPDMPALIYSWRVDEITMWSAPNIEGVDPLGKPYYVPDESRIRRQPVHSTSGPTPIVYTAMDPIETPGGPIRPVHMSHCVDFILHCTRLDSPPKRTRSDWR